MNLLKSCTQSKAVRTIGLMLTILFTWASTDGQIIEADITIPNGFHTGPPPSEMLENTTTRRLYAFDNVGTPQVAILNTVDNSVTTIPLSRPLPRFVTINVQTNRIYGIGYGSTEVVVMNAGDFSFSSIPLSNFFPAGGIAVNSSTNQIYLVGWDSNGIASIRVINVADNSFAMVQVPTVLSFLTGDNSPAFGNTFNGIEVNQTANRVYVSAKLLSGVHGLVVFDAESNSASVLSVPAFIANSQMVINPENKRIYIPGIDTLHGSTAFAVINGETNGVAVVDVSFATGGDVEIDTAMNRVFVIGYGHALGFDGTTLSLVSDAVGLDGDDVLVSSVTHRMYMGRIGNDGQHQFRIFNLGVTTPSGTDVTVTSHPVTLNFSSIIAPGTTFVSAADPVLACDAGNFGISDAYDIATTANYSGSITLGFSIRDSISEDDFNNLAILQHENGADLDVTTTVPARDYSDLRVYASSSSLGHFCIIRRGLHIKSLFDQSKAYKSGSTIPIKVQLQNSSNANASSASILLTTRDLKLISNNTTAPVIDSGNANPDYSFRYDVSLGGTGGGYIFNLSTKGLQSGQYVLSFYAGDDHSFFYTVKFEVK